MGNLKFEVGKAYQTRDGRKAVCLTTTLGCEFPIGVQVDNLFNRISIDGYFLTSKSESNIDIIGEWIEKPDIDWSAMPAWAEFVAMNADGTWYWYTNEPKFENGFWNANFKKGNIPVKYAPEFKGKPEYSLIKKTN